MGELTVDVALIVHGVPDGSDATLLVSRVQAMLSGVGRGIGCERISLSSPRCGMGEGVVDLVAELRGTITA